jgi:hypothetical protein
VHVWDNDCDKVCNNDESHTRETEHIDEGGDGLCDNCFEIVIPIL